MAPFDKLLLIPLLAAHQDKTFPTHY